MYIPNDDNIYCDLSIFFRNSPNSLSRMSRQVIGAKASNSGIEDVLHLNKNNHGKKTK